jgi:hypothetical protein
MVFTRCGVCDPPLPFLEKAARAGRGARRTADRWLAAGHRVQKKGGGAEECPGLHGVCEGHPGRGWHRRVGRQPLESLLQRERERRQAVGEVQPTVAEMHQLQPEPRRLGGVVILRVPGSLMDRPVAVGYLHCAFGCVGGLLVTPVVLARKARNPAPPRIPMMHFETSGELAAESLSNLQRGARWLGAHQDPKQVTAPTVAITSPSDPPLLSVRSASACDRNAD